MILVTGATGTNGRALLEILAESGACVRAMLRTADAAKDLPKRVEPIAGDFDDAASVENALSGVERAFLLTPSTEHAEEQQKRFVEIAARVGVRYIVKLSQFAAPRTRPFAFFATMPPWSKRCATAA